MIHLASRPPEGAQINTDLMSGIVANNIMLAKQPEGAKLKVIGVGGGGGNAINNMIKRGLRGVEFIAANTDIQALNHNLAEKTIQIGVGITKGLGAGADPEVGRKSVEEAADEIRSSLKGADMIFVTGGMGGGTGTGGAPAIAQIGKELGALVVAIVTKPFAWEGKKRIMIAEHGIAELRKSVDALIIIPNQKLLEIIDQKTSFMEAFLKVDEVLYNATRGISDIISRHGVVNVDFADVRTVMKGMGDALMGIGIAKGEHRAVEAAQNALNSPLLDGISISGAQGVLVNITGGADLTMHEVAEAVSIVEEASGGNAMVIHGVVNEDEPREELMITVVATGFKKQEQAKTENVITSKHRYEEQVTVTSGGSTNGFLRNGKLPPIVKVFPTSDNGNVQTHDTTLPKRQSEDNVNSPAYVRKGIQLNGKSNGNTEQNNGKAAYTVEEYSIFPESNLDKPAFLRKMLD